MLGLSMNLGMTSGSGPSGPAAGPTVSASPTVDSSTATINVLLTATGGTYAASGGGSVSVVREWLSAGVQSATGLADTPVTADFGNAFGYRETATEAGGSNPGSIIRQVSLGNVLPNIPDAFGSGDWSIANTGVSGQATIVILSMPGDNGDAITDIEYELAASGAWTSGGSIVDFLASGFTDGASTNVRIRAVNGIGAGPASNIEAVTTSDTTAPVQGGAGFDGTDTINTTTSKVPVDVFWMVDGNATPAAAQVVAGGGELDGTYEVTSSPDNEVIDVSSVSFGNHYLHRVLRDQTPAQNLSSVDSAQFAFSGSVPNAFVAGNWTLTDPSTSGDLLVTISALPTANSDAITDVEYRLDGGSWVSSGGTVTFTISGLTDAQSYDVELRCVSAAGNAAAGDLKAQTPTAGATAPAQFGSGDWSISDLGTNGDVRITITTLPSNGGSALTDLEYQVGAGAWTSLAGTATGNYDLAGFTDGSAVNVGVRAVNGVGNGTGSATKSVTSTGVPDAFVDANWSIADAASGGDATVTIASLPAANGQAITDVEYKIGAGSWVSSGGTVTFDITGGFTDGVSTGVILRAVNSNGDGPDGNSESVTTTAGGGGAVPTVVGASAAGSHNGFSLAWSAGHASGDIAIVTISNVGNHATVSAASLGTGWTELSSFGTGFGSGDIRQIIFTKTATSGAEAAATIPNPAGSYSASIIVINGANTVSVLAATNQSTASTTASLTGGTTGQANTLCVFSVSEPIDSDTDQMSAFADTNQASVTYRAGVNDNRFGTGTGVHTGSGEKATAGTVGPVTGTIGASVKYCGAVLECF